MSFKNEKIKILALETSCDETAAAIVENGTDILSNVVFSQVDLHAVYGGVVPEIASRAHVSACDKVIDIALQNAKLSFSDIDALAVTYGPGLVGALLTGVSYMKGLAYSTGLNLIPVNHIHGHVFANFLSEPRPSFPFLCLIASGGHSHIVIINEKYEFEIIGRTLDDASGEAFDKVARVLGLSYPGGPQLSKMAQNGNPSALKLSTPKVDGKYNFSFSGLKTAFINAVHKLEQKGEQIPKEDFAASFEDKITNLLSEKAVNAALYFSINNICIAGGVAANSKLREKMQNLANKNNLNLFMPSIDFCTDNAAMIASAAYFIIKKDNDLDLSLNAVPNLSIV